jgi:hypothetical protein
MGGGLLGGERCLVLSDRVQDEPVDLPAALALSENLAPRSCLRRRLTGGSELRPSLVGQFQELTRRQTCLPQDGSQRAPLHDATLRDNGHPASLIPVDRVAAPGPHMGEPDRLQRADNLAHGKVR